MDEMLQKLKQQVALAHEYGFPFATLPVNLAIAQKLIDILEEYAEIDPGWLLDRLERKQATQVLPE